MEEKLRPTWEANQREQEELESSSHFGQMIELDSSNEDDGNPISIDRTYNGNLQFDKNRREKAVEKTQQYRKNKAEGNDLTSNNKEGPKKQPKKIDYKTVYNLKGEQVRVTFEEHEQGIKDGIFPPLTSSIIIR